RTGAPGRDGRPGVGRTTRLVDYPTREKGTQRMTTATAPKTAEADITAMSFEQVQAELKAIPDRQQQAIQGGDVAAIRRLKARASALKEQATCIRIDNLKAAL